MRRLVFAFVVLSASSACAVAFSPGLDPAPAPTKAPDSAETPSAPEQIVKAVTATSPPAVGMSLVVGGERMDAGPLPKPPVPVVLLP